MLLLTLQGHRFNLTLMHPFQQLYCHSSVLNGGNINVLEPLVITTGADRNTETINGQTPLSIARIAGHLDIEEVLKGNVLCTLSCPYIVVLHYLSSKPFLFSVSGSLEGNRG